ncbi:hypothetical protein GJ496_003677 [Pomphorhynchus laevis]|nr:hypothetical protein GJ496_003677 [Pomphorhynchus laevis]
MKTSRKGDLVLFKRLNYNYFHIAEITIGIKKNSELILPLAERKITIYISDVDNEPPQFKHDHYSATIPSSIPIGTEIFPAEGRIFAYDGDLGINCSLYYEVKDFVPPTEKTPFIINAESGVIRTNIKFEHPLDYHFVVKACQMPELKKCSYTNMRISVHTANQNPPRLSSGVVSLYAMEDIETKTKTQVELGQLSVYDKDKNANITASVTCPNEERFPITISFNKKKNLLKIFSNNKVKLTPSKSIQCSIIITDGVFTDYCDVSLTIFPYIRFTNEPNEFMISANISNGDTIGKVAVENSINSPVEYTISAKRSNSLRSQLCIDQHGRLYVCKDINKPLKPGIYKFTVSAFYKHLDNKIYSSHTPVTVRVDKRAKSVNYLGLLRSPVLHRYSTTNRYLYSVMVFLFILVVVGLAVLTGLACINRRTSISISTGDMDYDYPLHRTKMKATKRTIFPFLRRFKNSGKFDVYNRNVPLGKSQYSQLAVRDADDLVMNTHISDNSPFTSNSFDTRQKSFTYDDHEHYLIRRACKSFPLHSVQSLQNACKVSHIENLRRPCQWNRSIRKKEIHDQQQFRSPIGSPSTISLDSCSPKFHAINKDFANWKQSKIVDDVCLNSLDIINKANWVEVDYEKNADYNDDGTVGNGQPAYIVSAGLIITPVKKETPKVSKQV